MKKMTNKLRDKIIYIGIACVIIGTIIGNLFGFMIVRSLSKTPRDKVYVPTPDLLKNDDDSTWRIGDKEFFITYRTVRQDNEGHVVFEFHFTSKDILMQPK